MSIIDLYEYLKTADTTDLDKVYNEAVNKYQADMVNLVMYELYKYGRKDLGLKEIRDKQNKFRQNLINKYKTCVVTKHGELMCEACHIIPYSECTVDQLYDVNNGLLLDAGIHKLFDRHLVSIDPVYKQFMVSKQILIDSDYSCIAHYHCEAVQLEPKTLTYLKTHFERFSYMNK